MRTLAAIALAALLAACTTTRPLPTLASYNGGYRGIGIDAVLAGDPNDPRVAWLEWNGRRDIVWPPGFTARFAPNLQVLDGSGTVVFRAGDRISGGCAIGEDLLLIRPGG